MHSAVVQWLIIAAQIHLTKPGRSSVQVQILLAACRIFTMVRISDNEWSQLNIWRNPFRQSSVSQKQYIIIHTHHNTYIYQIWQKDDLP